MHPAGHRPAAATPPTPRAGAGGLRPPLREILCEPASKTSNPELDETTPDPATVVAAVRAYLEGGQVAGDTLAAVAERVGVSVERLLAVMRLLFDIDERPGLVVPARWR